ncbi:hypothetical protein C1H76_6364 [Elsinoe australis]|uniref:Uncharacterized protein n=1 Tax=Elsinoe australis TaxID=40998 RepID=A0A4U7AXA5_9PEZI|nr:hypothetical protein C1H76_6364 [Elsinoe australis]
MPGVKTVTYVTKGGALVKTGKNLNNVWKDAQSAYRERKAEIKAVRKADLDEKQARRALDRLEVDSDDESIASSRRSSNTSPRTSTQIRRKPVPPSRPHPERRDSASSTSSRRSERHSPRSPRKHGPSRLRFEDHLSSPPRSSNGKELVRRNTDGAIPSMHHYHPSSRPRSSTRSASMTELEMSLAYGDLPDQDARPTGALARPLEENELRNQVSRLQQLLDEANCLQYSAVAMIEQLQKNPDQMAAVALTLGEISNLVTKMAPAGLSGLKAAFPAVFALLASPQFMIAAGVGVGVTVIAFGGYKIIKKIKAKKAGEKMLAEGGEEETEEEELQEIRSDLSRIEVWRRGIADAQAGSQGTSVDGEFITPVASRQLIQEGRLREGDLKSVKSGRGKKEKEKGKSGKGKDKEREKEKKREKERKKSRREDDEESVLDKGRALIKHPDGIPNGIKSLFKKEGPRRSESSLARA